MKWGVKMPLMGKLPEVLGLRELYPAPQLLVSSK
jgi:hypothetical protein